MNIKSKIIITVVLLTSAAFVFAKPNNIIRGNKKFKEIALTFDCHHLDSSTVKILDILKEKNVKATFFLTGDFIETHPEIVKRIYEEHHEIGSHLYRHKELAIFKNNKFSKVKDLTEESFKNLLKKVGYRT